tara:strand:+ start:1050 stop:1637 length:588 start_codon:yes stop_codon:yes gene_type:complete
MLPPVLQRMKDLGMEVFENGAYNLNLFGIRSIDKSAETFNDLLGCAYKEADGSEWRVAYWTATTDAGLYWLENPMNVDGTAALVANRQYRGVYKLGKHQGKYEALVQSGAPVAVYRDSDESKSYDYDPSTITEGYFGINIHKAGKVSTQVGKWSAGCQVHSRESGFNDMMDLVKNQFSHHPTWSTVTYTLLDQWW